MLKSACMILSGTLFLLLSLPVTGAGAAPPSTNGTLTVVITNLRNYQGMINIAIFSSAEGFPENAQLAVRKQIVQLSSGTDPKIEFNDLPYGSYAIAVFHDENENQILDKNWLGIPKEGVGFSNNPAFFTGPPSFDKAKFVLNSVKQSLTIKLKY